MPTYQNTIKEAISIEGKGLHTGMPVKMTLNPANENTGFVFRRVDLPGEPTIPADANWVTETSRGTTLEFSGAKVSTIEHILAALVGMNLHNIIIELTAQEVPIMDGSSMPFIHLIQKVGVQQQKALVEYYSINKTISYRDEEKNVEMIAMPYDGYKITSMIDFDSEILGQQHAAMNDLSEFEKEIASARTFVFFRELLFLAKNNLIKGGDVDNAVIVVDQPVNEEELDELAIILNKPKIRVDKNGFLNSSPLRFTNEPARHKLLDIVGDLSLIGKPLKARIIASRPGHKTNVEFAKLIKKQII
jgi:UDP-3-O-[3-hydroxymyristoyl] N-acetylglucosamine deacetylase / 3-hydroxyacyl-[acyl-carrier-protein] dehydratase